MPAIVLLASDTSPRWNGLVTTLRSMHLRVRRVETGEDAVRLHERLGTGLALISTDLRDVHALDVCRRIRRDSDVPLMVLTSEANTLDRILALELGADDVVAANCDAEELQERVKAALRRGGNVELERDRDDVLDFGSITVDRSTCTVVVGGESWRLTPMETKLLWMLAQHAGQVIEAEELLESVWGYPRGINTRTLDVHIGRLRKKLGEDGGAPRHIITVRGVGYRFEPPEPPDRS